MLTFACDENFAYLHTKEREREGSVGGGEGRGEAGDYINSQLKSKLVTTASGFSIGTLKEARYINVWVTPSFGTDNAIVEKRFQKISNVGHKDCRNR